MAEVERQHAFKLRGYGLRDAQSTASFQNLGSRPTGDSRTIMSRVILAFGSRVTLLLWAIAVALQLWVFAACKAWTAAESGDDTVTDRSLPPGHEESQGWSLVDIVSLGYTLTRSDVAPPWIVCTDGLVVGEGAITAKVDDDSGGWRRITVLVGRGFNTLVIKFAVNRATSTASAELALTHVRSSWDVIINGKHSEDLLIREGYIDLIDEPDGQRLFFYLVVTCSDPQSGPVGIALPLVGVIDL